MRKNAFLLLAALLPVAACSPSQLTSYTAALNATGNVLKQVGADLVAIDCQSANLISVVAKDANAAARVQAALAKNAQIAKDACPALTGAPAVQVVAGG